MRIEETKQKEKNEKSIAPTMAPLRTPGLSGGVKSIVLSGFLVLPRTPNYPPGPALPVRCGA